ncbi:hypothetical protein ABBQ38_010105 [Trebouxia sp. C0009 RCD-2024]
MIPIDSLVGRLPRDALKHVRIADLYQDMERAWPTLSPEVQDQLYLANFRVNENTFERIFIEVQDDNTLNPLRRADTTPPKKRLAITLFFLAQGDHYHSIATTFGIHKSSVSTHLHAVMPVLERKLSQETSDFQHTMSCGRSWQTFRTSAVCRNVEAPSTVVSFPWKHQQACITTSISVIRTSMLLFCWQLSMPEASLLVLT